MLDTLDDGLLEMLKEVVLEEVLWEQCCNPQNSYNVLKADALL